MYVRASDVSVSFNRNVFRHEFDTCNAANDLQAHDIIQDCTTFPLPCRVQVIKYALHNQ